MAKSNYFRIDHSTEPAVVGVWPQLDGPPGMTKKDVNSFALLRACEYLPAELPRMDRLVVERGAKLTDVMSCGYLPVHLGLVVSQRFVDLLAGLNLGPMQSTSVSFSSKRHVTAYSFLFFAPSLENIEWRKTVFTETSVGGTKRFAEHGFSSPSDFTKNYARVRSSRTHALTLTTVQLLSPLDVFRLPQDFRSLHVSSRLAKKLRKEEISGITLEPSEIHFTNA